jgi:hypothetical protein
MEEHLFNGFRYFATYSDGELAKIEHEKETPEFLFKYFSLSKYNIEALLKNYLYASHPYELNDILDSSRFLFFSSKPIEFRVYENFFRGKFDTREKLIKFYENDIENGCSNYISSLYINISRMYGVISVSENGNNELMWPHYTQEKGFQIKFKSKVLYNTVSEKLKAAESLLGLFPINYTPKIQPIDISDFRRFDIPFSYSTNIKLDKWNYENEWRFIVSKPSVGIPFRKLAFSIFEDYNFKPEDRYIKYGVDAIESICLGFNFFSGSDFLIQWKGEREIEVEPRKEDERYGWYIQFLNYIVEELYGKVYLSGVKYETELNGSPYLVRTKERVEITKLQESKYLIVRTEEIIKFK